ncbi:MAG: alkyl sulfatase dimerization domain-containing protein [Candidatus Competibacteraceae bacterium]
MLLQRNPFGHVDQAIGKNVANGNTGLIAPNRLVSEEFEEITLDGVKMVFQNAPDTEAPVEMNTYFPQFKALWSSEIITGTIHNIYTIRGAAIAQRDQLVEGNQRSALQVRPGSRSDIRLAQLAALQKTSVSRKCYARSAPYANLNNQALHYANLGVTINEIRTSTRCRRACGSSRAARSYPGDVQNNARAVINRFLSHYDGNPTNLIPLSPADSAPLYVEMMGGAGRSRARPAAL